MTKQQFLEKLNEIKDIFEWQVNNDLQIRGWSRGDCFCPITAVNYAEHLVYTPVDEVDKAWKRLGMSQDEAGSIIWAADADFDYIKNPAGAINYDRELRNEIRIILGFGPSEGIDI